MILGGFAGYLQNPVATSTVTLRRARCLNDSTLISSIVDGDNFYVALVVGWELKQSTFCLCVRLALPLPAA